MDLISQLDCNYAAEGIVRQAFTYWTFGASQESFAKMFEVKKKHFFVGLNKNVKNPLFSRKIGYSYRSEKIDLADSEFRTPESKFRLFGSCLSRCF